MTRKIGFTIALIAASACSAANSTGPSTVISIQLLDDSGAPAGRNRIEVTPSDAAPLFVSTSTHGTVDVAVPAGGSYVVSVIPRNSFVSGNPNLTRTVTVAENERTQLQFTLYRGGISSAEPFPEGPGY